MFRSLLAFVLLSLFINASAFAQTAASIRHTYDKALHLIKAGEFTHYQEQRDKLKDFPLLPDLDYQYLKATLKSVTFEQAMTFKGSYQRYPFFPQFHNLYFDELALRKDWGSLLQWQEETPTTYYRQCDYYQALLATGNRQEAYAGMAEIWLMAKPLVSHCKPLYIAWKADGRLTDDMILQRMRAAFEERRGAVIDALVGTLSSDTGRQQAQLTQTLFKQPQKLNDIVKEAPVNTLDPELIEVAYKHLARKKISKAVELYYTMLDKVQFSQHVQTELAEFVAFRLTGMEGEAFRTWRDHVLENSNDMKLIENRIRLAIRQGDWQDIDKWIGELSLPLKRTLRWQYWRARVEQSQGKEKMARKRLASLLGERSFYSLVAAYTLGKEVEYDTKTATFTPKIPADYEIFLKRVKVWLALGENHRAKMEWKTLLRHASPEERQSLAVYASHEHHKNRNRWQYFAILATIKARMWDYMHLRFPLLYSYWFNNFAKENKLRATTLIALSRQESALDPKVMSPVGARGLMQIMPATAADTAEKFKIPYKRETDLYQVKTNIEIGSKYLKRLMQRYDDNRIFSFAAYNAGPYRVTQWRRYSNKKLDVFGFIESIPFKETRRYVKNILMFEVYYQRLIGLQQSFLSEKEREQKY